MQNAVSYRTYEELIRQGWFVSQLPELARDLEVLEHYGRMEREQRRKLLQLAQEVQNSRTGEDLQEHGFSHFENQSPSTKSNRLTG